MSMGRNGCDLPLDIAESFAGSTVLLTGATGYIGSLVLEQLLRVCPNVSRVLLLIRSKRGVPPHDRMQSLLHHELFHLLDQDQLRKVHVVEGDMLLPGCGINQSNMPLVAAVTHVVHGAASIKFTDHIFKSLATNYQAVRELASLVSTACPKLRSFTHISTAYVNGHLPQGSSVPERLLPARDAEGRLIQHAVFVRQLLSLSAPEAERKAAGLFPNNYCLTKWLAEQMLDEDFPHLRLALIRPTIVGSVALKPIAGFIGNKSGATGAALAIAAGLWRYSQHSPTSIMDIVPGDTVAAAVLLATSAAAASPVSPSNRRDRAGPLIVHVGTSSSPSPLTTGRFYRNVQTYFKSHPLPAAAQLGSIPEKLLIVRSPLLGAILDTASDAWWRLVALWVALTGRRHLAQKIVDAWQAVKTFNQRRMQFNMRFETNQLRRLASLLSVDDMQALGPVWGQWVPANHPSAETTGLSHCAEESAQIVLNEGDMPCSLRSQEQWARYLSDYMRGTRALVLGQSLVTLHSKKAS